MKIIRAVSLALICGFWAIIFGACAAKHKTAPNWTIIIQPYADIAPEKVDYVYAEMKKVYPYVELRNSIELPASAYYQPRDRYRADSLIAQLQRNAAKQNTIIALTSKDISTTKNGIRDWGVMGLGFRPGNACVASDFRLSPDNRMMQLFKVAIHELGHTQGLPHCVVKSCFMRDAEGRNPTDEEVDFCVECKKILVSKGMNFE